MEGLERGLRWSSKRYGKRDDFGGDEIREREREVGEVTNKGLGWRGPSILFTDRESEKKISLTASVIFISLKPLRSPFSWSCPRGHSR